jgi:two-component system, NarL family, sensor histidine kinase DevS
MVSGQRGLRAALQALPDAVVIVGMDGRVVQANQLAASLSGYSRNELVGMAVEELVPEALRTVHVAHRATYRREPAVRSMGAKLDIRLRRRDGSEFPADVALSPVETEHGVLVVTSVRDITERKRAAEELVRAQEQVAVLRERERIARELLHDGAIQALFAVGMALQSMATMIQDRALSARLDAVVGRIDDVIRDLRSYVFGLRPGPAANRPLSLALRELAGQFEQQYEVGCPVEVDEVAAAELASRAADVVQVAREALSNVGRHAWATTCRLSLRREPGGAVLEIADDGRGFVPGAGAGGRGLRNLRDSAAAMGGSLDIVSALGERTKVTLRLPK